MQQRNIMLWIAVSLAAVQVVLLGLVVAARVGHPLSAAVAIPLGVSGHALAVAPDGRRVLVGGGGRIAVVDVATKTTVGTLGAGTGSGLAISPDGRTAYDMAGGGLINVIDLTTNLGVGAITLTGAGIDIFELIAVTPDGRRLIGADAGRGNIAAVDVATGSAMPLANSSPGLTPPALTPDASRIYVTPEEPTGPGLVRVVDTTTGTAREVPGSEGIYEVVMAPDGQSVYGFASGGTRVIDTATDTVRETIGTGFVIGATFVAHDGTHIFVFGGEDMMEVRTLENQVVARAPIGGFATDVGMAPDGTSLYVLVDDSLLVFDVHAYA